MKKHGFMLLFLFVIGFADAQENHLNLSGISLRDINGKQIELGELLESKKISLLIFWQQDDKMSCTLINEIYENVSDSLTLWDLQVIAVLEKSSFLGISENNYLQVNTPAIICLSDVNSVLSRYLSVNEFPYTMLIDNTGQLICRQRGYCSDASEQLCKKVRDCLSKIIVL